MEPCAALIFRDILHKMISIYQTYIITISSVYLSRIVLSRPDLRFISLKIERTIERTWKLNANVL